MAQLRQDHGEFERAGTVIAVVGPEDHAAFASFWQKNRLPFIGLPDPGHTILKRYGQEIKLFKFGRMPAQVLIDKYGYARFVYYGHDMTDIPATGEVLGLIASLERKGKDSGQKGAGP
jgi:peroxiredoxin Q/BCP